MAVNLDPYTIQAAALTWQPALSAAAYPAGPNQVYYLGVALSSKQVGDLPVLGLPAGVTKTVVYSNSAQVFAYTDSYTVYRLETGPSFVGPLSISLSATSQVNPADNPYWAISAARMDGVLEQSYFVSAANSGKVFLSLAYGLSNVGAAQTAQIFTHRSQSSIPTRTRVVRTISISGPSDQLCLVALYSPTEAVLFAYRGALTSCFDGLFLALGPALLDRVRLSITKQASNVGRTGAIQFADYAISLTTTPDVLLRTGSLQKIGHALDPATTALAWYVRNVQNDGGLLTYSGETILGRMARERPPDLPPVPGPFTGREALEYILTQWAAKYSWLTWLPLPEFYLSSDTAMPTFPGLLLVNGTPGDTTPVPFSQRKTMRQWLEEYFKVFEGYTFQTTADGSLEVVPPPWADTSLRTSLSNDDFLSLSSGEDSSSIRNLATVTSQGLEFPSGDTLVQLETYTYPGTGPGGAIVMAHPVKPGTTIMVHDVSATLTNPGIVYTPGVDYLFYIGNGIENSQIQRIPTGAIGASATIKVDYTYVMLLPDVMTPSGFALWGGLGGFHPWGPKIADLTLDYKPLGPIRSDGSYGELPILQMPASGQLVPYSPTKWPQQPNIVVFGSSLTIKWNIKDWLSQWQSGDIGPYNNPGQGTLLMDGVWHLIGNTTFTAPGTDNFSPQQAKMFLYGQWDDGRKDGIPGVWLRAEVWLADKKIAAPLATGIWVHGIWVQLNGTGSKLQKSNRSYIGRYTENDTDLAGVVASRNTYGPVEEPFETGFLLIPDTALLTRIARSKVAERLNPARIVQGEVAPPWRVTADSVGREYILPSGELGILESWTYNEAHAEQSSQVSLLARFRVTKNLLAAQTKSSALGLAAFGEGFYGG